MSNEKARKIGETIGALLVYALTYYSLYPLGGWRALWITIMIMGIHNRAEGTAKVVEHLVEALGRITR